MYVNVPRSLGECLVGRLEFSWFCGLGGLTLPRHREPVAESQDDANCDRWACFFRIAKISHTGPCRVGQASVCQESSISLRFPLAVRARGWVRVVNLISPTWVLGQARRVDGDLSHGMHGRNTEEEPFSDDGVPLGPWRGGVRPSMWDV